ncbi:ComEC/Rec2 family competence protein [Chloroflexota bacterium]
MLILTHPHADHLTGLLAVLERFHIKRVLYPDLASDSPLYDRWQKLVAEKGIPCTLAAAGQQIKMGGDLLLTVINPPVELYQDTKSDLDNNSVVLQLETGNVSFLFSGDILEEAERALLSHRADLDCTVLKVAHHGSAASTCPEFLATASPQLAVISAGENNRFQHPSPEVISVLEEQLGQAGILRTDVHGTVEFITDRERLWLKTRESQ